MADDIVATMQARNGGLFAGVLGIRFTGVSAEKDRLTAELTVRDDMCTVPGVMHGGAIMAFADTLGGHATGINLPPGAGTTTIESKTNFFAPAAPGTKVLAECVALHRGKRTMVWQTRVTSEDGRLLALVTQTQIVLEPRQRPEELLAAQFADKTTEEQKELLARLERSGAAVYRALAARETDPDARDELLAAAIREEQNAKVLEDMK